MTSDKLAVREKNGAILLQVLVSPRSKVEGILGAAGGALRVAVSAPPAEGKANRALLSFLAKRLGVPSSGLEVVKGAASKRKVVAIRGLGEAEVTSRLTGSEL